MDYLPIFLDATRQELQRSVGGILVDEPGRLQVTQPEAKVVWRNMVHHAVLDEADAEAEIERVLAHYAAHDVPFLWRVTPACRPHDLAARLEAHGLAHFETLGCLVADPTDFDPPTRADLRIESVTEENADLYIETMGEAWQMPSPGRARFRALLTQALAERRETEYACIAFLDGVARGTAQMSYVPHSVHFTGSAVHKEARGRGIYRELILHRMARLRAQGHGLVTVHAVSSTSAPICKRMGFREVFTMDSWCHPPEEADRA